MHDNPVFQPGMTIQDTSNARSPQTTVAEQSWLYDKTATSVSTKLPNSTLLLVPFGLIVLWAIAMVCFSVQKKQQHNIGKRPVLRRFQAVPCRHCAFFRDNPYLKCAIHPIDALTVNAIDCADYSTDVPPLQRQE